MLDLVRRTVAFALPTNLATVTRGLLRAPGFLVLSVISLGTGIGLSTATFAYVEANLNPTLPFANAAQLRFVRFEVAPWQHAPQQRDLIAVLRDLPFVDGVTQLNYESRKEVRGNGLGGNELISRFAPNFFEVTGLRPQLGRWPSADEARAGSAAVVSASLWSVGFLNRNEIGDAHVIVDGLTVPIVGVLPRGMFLGTDVWIPYGTESFLDSADAGPTSAPPILRLRKGVTRAAVNGQLAVAAARFKGMSDARRDGRPYSLSLDTYLFAGRKPGDREATLIGLAIGILLIAASNVAAFALARAYARRRDLALRVALGASRAAIAYEVLSEVAVISVLAAVVGTASSAALIGVLTHLTPKDLLGFGATYAVRLPVLTPAVFAYALLGLLASLVVAGGVPAWRAISLNPSDPLKDSGATTTGRSTSEFRILLIDELAIAMALMTITSLMLLSTRNLATFDFGFDLGKPVQARVSFVLPDGNGKPADSVRVYTSALARLRATPGVALVTTFMPSGFRAKKIISRSSFGAEQTLEPDGPVFDAGPDCFRTLGITVLDGRDFTDGDRANGTSAILTERAARVLFPRQHAVGSTIKIGGEESTYPWMRVIGVVRDVRLGTAGRGDPEIFVSTRDAVTHGSLVMVVRPAGTDPRFMTQLERALTGVLPPNSSIYIHRMAESFDLQVEINQFYTRSLSFIGSCALLLAVVGLFSVLSFTVGRRMREFAVRVALGASPRQVMMVVVKDGFETALAGTAIGAILSFWASAGISGMLFGMTITDPTALILAEAVLLLTATGASLVPGIRASHADPMEVLRAS